MMASAIPHATMPHAIMIMATAQQQKKQTVRLAHLPQNALVVIVCTATAAPLQRIAGIITVIAVSLILPVQVIAAKQRNLMEAVVHLLPNVQVVIVSIIFAAPHRLSAAIVTVKLAKTQITA